MPTAEAKITIIAISQKYVLAIVFPAPSASGRLTIRMISRSAFSANLRFTRLDAFSPSKYAVESTATARTKNHTPAMKSLG